MVWQRGTGQATYNLQIKDGQANLQLSFQLGRPDDPHLPPPDVPRTRHKGKRQKERDCARAAAHHARRAADTAVTAAGTVSEASATEGPPGTPIFTPPPPTPPASGGTALSNRRPSTRSTTVLVKMKMAAFARSAAESALKETLPKFIPGFNENIEFYRKE